MAHMKRCNGQMVNFDGVLRLLGALIGAAKVIDASLGPLGRG